MPAIRAFDCRRSVGGRPSRITRRSTTPDAAVSDLKRQVMRGARRKVFVGSHTKFGATSFSRFAGVDEFDDLVTGTNLPGHTALRYKAAGVRVVRA